MVSSRGLRAIPYRGICGKGEGRPFRPEDDALWNEVIPARRPWALHPLRAGAAVITRTIAAPHTRSRIALRAPEGDAVMTRMGEAAPRRSRRE